MLLLTLLRIDIHLLVLTLNQHCHLGHSPLAKPGSSWFLPPWQNTSLTQPLKPSVTLPPTGVYSGWFVSLCSFWNCSFWCCWPQAGQVLMMQLIQCIYTYQSLPVLLMHFAWQSPQFSLGTPDSTPNWSLWACHQSFLGFPRSGEDHSLKIIIGEKTLPEDVEPHPYAPSSVCQQLYIMSKAFINTATSSLSSFVEIRVPLHTVNSQHCSPLLAAWVFVSWTAAGGRRELKPPTVTFSHTLYS